MNDIQTTKPKVKTCPLCGIPTGVSNKTLSLHLEKPKTLEQEENTN